MKCPKCGKFMKKEGEFWVCEYCNLWYIEDEK